jgi:uncharacterized protein with ACT and thioredoxin-like domain
MPPVPPRSLPASALESVRLPKAIELDAAGPALHASLRERAQKLWNGGALLAPTAAWGDALVAALAQAQRSGHLVRGLELAEKTLEREARGLSLADARSANERGARVSRLLLVGSDGTERFYRQVERLAQKHAPRLLTIRVDASSDQLAAVVPQAAGVVRALMLEHKDDVVRVLWALYARNAD